MFKRMYKVGEVARIAKVTVRTLEGETEMSVEERFEGFQPEEHVAEAIRANTGAAAS